MVFKRLKLTSLLLITFIGFLVISGEASAAQWGPHLKDYSNSGMMQAAKTAYTDMGGTGWFPFTIMIPGAKTQTEKQQTTVLLTQMFQNANAHQMIPIIRITSKTCTGGWEKLDSTYSDLTREAFNDAAGAIGGIPGPIYVTWGNEVNMGLEWGNSLPEPPIYQAAFTQFRNGLNGKYAAAKSAFNISNPTSSINLSASDYYNALNRSAVCSPLAANPYQIVETSYSPPALLEHTIDGWQADRMWFSQGGGCSNPNPVVLTEFGLSPAYPFDRRINFVKTKYGQNWYSGNSEVKYVTPLLLDDPTNRTEIIVFGPGGQSIVMDPVGGGNSRSGGVCGPPIAVSTGTQSDVSGSCDVDKETPTGGEYNCSVTGNVTVMGVDNNGKEIRYGIKNAGILWVERPIGRVPDVFGSSADKKSMLEDTAPFKLATTGGNFVYKLDGIHCKKPNYFLVMCGSNVLEAFSVEDAGNPTDDVAAGVRTEGAASRLPPGVVRFDIRYDPRDIASRSGQATPVPLTVTAPFLECGAPNVCERPMWDQTYKTCSGGTSSEYTDMRFPSGWPSYSKTVTPLTCLSGAGNCMRLVRGLVALGLSQAFKGSETVTSTDSKATAIAAAYGQVPYTNYGSNSCADIKAINDKAKTNNIIWGGAGAFLSMSPGEAWKMCAAAQAAFPNYGVCQGTFGTVKFNEINLPWGPQNPLKHSSDYFPYSLCAANTLGATASPINPAPGEDSELIPDVTQGDLKCSGKPPGLDVDCDPDVDPYDDTQAAAPVTFGYETGQYIRAMAASEDLRRAYSSPLQGGGTVPASDNTSCSQDPSTTSGPRISRTKRFGRECTIGATPGGVRFIPYSTDVALYHQIIALIGYCSLLANANDPVCETEISGGTTMFLKLLVPWQNRIESNFEQVADNLLPPGQCVTEVDALGSVEGVAITDGIREQWDPPFPGMIKDTSRQVVETLFDIFTRPRN